MDGHAGPDRLYLRVAIRAFLLLGCAWPSASAGQTGLETPHGDLSVPCVACHSTEDWKELLDPLPFDHATTGFELVGMHGTLDCLTCHQHLVLANIGSACADCHIDPHLGELGFGCGACHGALSRDPRFGVLDLFHDTTLFPLTGAHRALECGSCHREPPPFEYQLTPIECSACHGDEFLTAEPAHLDAGFGQDCESCHRTRSWSPADAGPGFDHDPFFALRGAHAPLGCDVCHASGFRGTPSDCFACHRADYTSARDPDHVALGWPTDCEVCHGTSRWPGATQVDHDVFFPLLGVHAVLDCGACHADGFMGTPRECALCHQDDYATAMDPDHGSSAFGLDCERCHSERSWQVARIDHDPFFPLLGAHQGLGCESCHDAGFATTSAQCYSCHAAAFEEALSPDHLAAGFSIQCEDCHDTRTWDTGRIDHSFFPHLGGHADLECTDCHSGVFRGNPSACVDCHQSDYDDTDHAAEGLPLACELCHDIFDWSSDELDHSFFPLVLGHGGLDCLDCHDEGGFGDTSRQCIGCHEDDYSSARNPDHAAAGFPTDCEQCHRISDWADADFDHDSFYFAIYFGSHATVWDTCETCHPNPFDFGVFECLTCHEHNPADTNAIHKGIEDYEYDSVVCLLCHGLQ